MKTVETHTMPAHWASALMNNGISGLCPAEIRSLCQYLRINPEFKNPVACSEEITNERFTFYPGNVRLTECFVYTFLRGQ